MLKQIMKIASTWFVFDKTRTEPCDFYIGRPIPGWFLQLDIPLVFQNDVLLTTKVGCLGFIQPLPIWSEVSSVVTCMRPIVRFKGREERGSMFKCVHGYSNHKHL